MTQHTPSPLAPLIGRALRRLRELHALDHRGAHAMLCVQVESNVKLYDLMRYRLGFDGKPAREPMLSVLLMLNALTGNGERILRRYEDETVPPAIVMREGLRNVTEFAEPPIDLQENPWATIRAEIALWQTLDPHAVDAILAARIPVLTELHQAVGGHSPGGYRKGDPPLITPQAWLDAVLAP